MMEKIDNTLLMQRLHEALTRQAEQSENLYRRTGGGSGDGGAMEGRIGKLEADVGHIAADMRELKQDVREIKKDAREDFRILFGALIVVALGLATLMGKGFQWF